MCILNFHVDNCKRFQKETSQIVTDEVKLIEENILKTKRGEEVPEDKKFFNLDGLMDKIFKLEEFTDR